MVLQTEARKLVDLNDAERLVSEVEEIPTVILLVDLTDFVTNSSRGSGPVHSIIILGPDLHVIVH
jgi:hypothetical protein